MSTTAQPTQQAAPQQPQPTQQTAPQAPAAQPQAAAVTNQPVKAHPLDGIQIPASLQLFKQQFAAPMSTFLACFKSREEGERIFRRETEYAVAAMQSNTYLVTCAQKYPQELINAMQSVALSGLSLAPTLRQGYLVPFGGKITFMPSYCGLRDLLVRTGLCINIEAHLVYKDDFFDITHGVGGTITHKPDVFSKNRTDKDIRGGYFFATLPSGKYVFDAMSIDEIEKVRKASPSANNGPWVNWYPEMCRKTLIRKGYNSIPHTNVSDENLKVFQVVKTMDDGFFYDKDERKTPKRSNFDEDDVIDAEEV